MSIIYIELKPVDTGPTCISICQLLTAQRTSEKLAAGSTRRLYSALMAQNISNVAEGICHMGLSQKQFTVVLCK